MSKNKYAVIVLSHSSYSDLWPVLIESYSNFFHSDKFDYFITSDSLESFEPGNDCQFKFLAYKPDVSWSDALIEVLNKVDYEKVIFSFDDLILTDEVDVKELISKLESNHSNYLKLIASHVRFYDRFFRREDVFEVSDGDTYKGSLVFTALDREMIKEIISNPEVKGLSPWMFERSISSLLPKEMTYSALRHNLFKFRNLVIKGAIDYLAFLKVRNDSKLDLVLNRPFMGWRLGIQYYSKWLVFTVIKYFMPSALFGLLRKLKQSVAKVR
jgi:tetrahydromethanopterin S-methyltransferase subunit B